MCLPILVHHCAGQCQGCLRVARALARERVRRGTVSMADPDALLAAAEVRALGCRGVSDLDVLGYRTYLQAKSALNCLDAAL
jgi:hypothetical protein